jgi:hypothetical protein
VTSALVDNLINNNPTPVSNMNVSTITTNAQQSEVKTSIAETNSNVEASAPASQLFNSQPNPTQAFINSEQQQQQQIAPPTSLPEHLIPSAPPASTVVNQSFVNTEGRPFST